MHPKLSHFRTPNSAIRAPNSAGRTPNSAGISGHHKLSHFRTTQLSYQDAQLSWYIRTPHFRTPNSAIRAPNSAGMDTTSSATSGHPTQLSGHPTQLSGRPTQLSGRPTQLSGHPTQLVYRHPKLTTMGEEAEEERVSTLGSFLISSRAFSASSRTLVRSSTAESYQGGSGGVKLVEFTNESMRS